MFACRVSLDRSLHCTFVLGAFMHGHGRHCCVRRT
jgi:hypothetical protein